MTPPMCTDSVVQLCCIHYQRQTSERQAAVACHGIQPLEGGTLCYLVNMTQAATNVDKTVWPNIVLSGSACSPSQPELESSSAPLRAHVHQHCTAQYYHRVGRAVRIEQIQLLVQDVTLTAAVSAHVGLSSSRLASGSSQ